MTAASTMNDRPDSDGRQRVRAFIEHPRVQNAEMRGLRDEIRELKTRLSPSSSRRLDPRYCQGEKP